MLRSCGGNSLPLLFSRGNWEKRMILAAAAGIGSAIVGGFYVAFSCTVMPALRRRPAREAEAAMVTINQQAVRLPFMVLFFGTALVSAGTLVQQVVNPLDDGLFMRTLGAACYLAGWLATMAINVPLNERLARNDIGWAEFERPWSRANLTRAVLSSVGAALLILS
jgi:uncharacterized membrane protein